jgi:hypothetical protein
MSSMPKAPEHRGDIESVPTSDLRKIAAFYARLAAKADCNDGSKERHSIDEEMPTVEKQP